MFPGVDPGMGVPRHEPAGNVRRDARLSAQVEPIDMRRNLRHRTMVLRQIVDEHRAARRIFVENRLERRSLRSLVGEHAQVDAVLGKLADGLLVAITRPFLTWQDTARDKL